MGPQAARGELRDRRVADNGFSTKERRRTPLAVSAAYRTSMAEFAGMTNLAVWSSRTTDIDASAEVALREVIDGLRERNIELHIARAAVELRERLDDVELTNAIGAERFHATVTAAVEAVHQLSDFQHDPPLFHKTGEVAKGTDGSP